MYDARQVARSMIERAQSKGILLSNLKLQKLLYIAHGGMLAVHDRTLVQPNSFSAWRYGPVIEDLYHDLKVYGAGTVKPDDRYIQRWDRVPDSDEVAIGMIDSVLGHFGSWSGANLVEWSHSADSPWHAVYSGFGSGMISDIQIKQYFKERVVKPS